MPRHFHVTSAHHGGCYASEVIIDGPTAYYVKITGWYTFPINIWFRKDTMRNGAMVLEIN